MSTTHETVIRHWEMLSYIPRSPSRISTQKLVDKLGSAGFPHSKRTIERDLVGLKNFFHYSKEVDGKTHYWYWGPDAKRLDIQGMTASIALAWQMSQQLLERTLPPGTLEHIKPYFEQSEKTLRSYENNKSLPWRSKFRVIKGQLELKAPEVKSEVHGLLCEALLEGVQVTIHYQSGGRPAPTPRDVSPLGLVLRGSVYYLVAVSMKENEVRQYLLHRITKVKLLITDAVRPKKFKLDDYVNTEFEYPLDEKINKLRLRVAPSIARYLFERKLSDDQKISDIKGTDDKRVTASVPNNRTLIWWLLTFGEDVTVEAPASLRKKLKTTAAKMSANYGN